MRITKTKLEQVEYTVDVLCNKCGESCIPPHERESPGQPVKYVDDVGFVHITMDEHLQLRGPNLYGLIEQTVTGGCDSYALQDLRSYTFSMCEGCLKVLFDDFKIPVQVKEINIHEA